MQINEEQKVVSAASGEKPWTEESLTARFGRVVREAREQAGYTIERVALASRISLGLLKALEEGRADRLPGQVFVRGFIRNLCKLYQIDPTDMLLLADEAMGKDAFDPKPQPLKKEDPKWDLTHEHRHWRSRKIRRASALFIARHFQLVPLLSFLLILGLTVTGFLYMIKILAGIPDGLFSARSVGQAITSELSGERVVETTIQKDSATRTAAGTAVTKTLDSLPSSTVFFAGKSPQYLEIKANEPVAVEMQRDGGAFVGMQLEPKNHRVMFNDRAELLIHNAKSVQLSLDGKILDPTVNSGQTMRITFKKIPQIKQKTRKM